MTGKTCPYCRYEIFAGEEMEPCPLCEATHHSECWIENGGCAVVGCEAVADAPDHSRIVITESDLESPTNPAPVGAPPARVSGPKFVVPQVGKILIISAVVLVALAIAAAFYLRSITQTEEGPRINWGNPAAKQGPD